jgi:catechol 2,3-dioxygenase-like lactoylglutathione lyase family enzyme
MSATELFAGVPVTDLAAALAWYERLFGAAPDFHPNDDEAVWRVAGGWVYVVRDPERAGRALLTVLVDDLDAQVTALRARGIEPDSVEGETIRKAAITDADGNRVTFAHPGGG